jgi:hypothetical protein
MIILAAMTASRAVMFIARMTLRIMKPGPASRLLVMGILGEFRLLFRNETKSKVRWKQLISQPIYSRMNEDNVSKGYDLIVGCVILSLYEVAVGSKVFGSAAPQVK